ncbi:hypothetical protein CEXT_154431 [Caerostris extrusa]|uniref:Uncharacterized protein n=1 Tax=Caerostris extrusa TaxID=172846 RepID=A0AAV4XJ10_CAEEX|nr:hypothetical protein CEXT_154431 [Caerostris extrusa]
MHSSPCICRRLVIVMRRGTRRDQLNNKFVALAELLKISQLRSRVKAVQVPLRYLSLTPPDQYTRVTNERDDEIRVPLICLRMTGK